MTNKDYILSVMLQCEWDSKIKEHVGSYYLSSTQTTREALYEGRCETVCLHASCTDTSVIWDLRAKLLVACKVTPAIWLNLSDSRNIVIIHFGLLLKERTLDSIGHDLLKKYNVISLLWMIRYISLLTNTFTQWILIGA